MKSLLIVSFLIFSSVLLYSQEKTLIKSNLDHGGYGAPVIKASQISGQIGVFVGGRGAWIINHTFAVGIGGYGLVSNIPKKGSTSDNPPRLMMGYGGLELEVIIKSDNIFHFTVHSLFGYGAVDYRDDDYGETSLNSLNSSDAFYVIEPALNLEINVTTFFRVGLGASYLYVTGVGLPGLTNEDLDGPAGNLIFKFGGF